MRPQKDETAILSDNIKASAGTYFKSVNVSTFCCKLRAPLTRRNLYGRAINACYDTWNLKRELVDTIADRSFAIGRLLYSHMRYA